LSLKEGAVLSSTDHHKMRAAAPAIAYHMSMAQRDTFLILGLRRKRARLAGEIAAAEQRLAPVREALTQVDALIRLFEGSNPELIPPIRPTPRCLFFRHGEQQRLCVAALREAGRPLPTRKVTDYVMLAKGLPSGNAAVREKVAQQTRTALVRLEKRGKVRRVVCEPEMWWELVG
jgi:hypothetical protein